MAHQSTNPPGAKQLLENDPECVYVDVRTVDEFEQGHVPGAYNIPILFRTGGGMQPNPDFLPAVTRRFPKGQRIVFGCKSGGRSERACELLVGLGYAHLVNMVGGFHGAYDMTGNVIEPGWAACGYDTERESLPGRSWKELTAR